MAIGKIDCTVHKKLCDQYKIGGYPTLKYSLDGGDIVDYPGGRGEAELIKFANKMSAPAVTLVSSYEHAMKKLQGDDDEEGASEQQQQQHGVIFVMYDPQVQSIGLYKNRPMPPVEEFLRTTEVTIAFEKVARKEQVNANFAILSPGSDCCKSFQTSDTSNNPDTNGATDELENTPFVARLEENVPPRIWQPPASPSDYVSSLHAFVADNYFPLVNQVGPDNFHKLGRHGRPLVLGVVQGNNQAQVQTIKQQLLDFCLNGPPEIVSRYYFGWIDGHLWQKFLEQFEIKMADLPQVFVLDVPKKRYWQNSTYTGKENGIQALMEDIRDGKVSSKVSSGTGKPSITGFWGVVKFLESTFLENMPWSILILISVCAAFAILVVPPPEDLRPPYKNQHARKRPQGEETTTAAEATSDKATTEAKKEK
jgi:hypothetical protein